jgi:hypothetical protein
VTPNDFTDLDVIEKRLANFEDRYNQAARTFKWKFTTNDLKRPPGPARTPRLSRTRAA